MLDRYLPELFIPSRVDTEHPEDGFFFVSPVASGIDTDGGQFAAFAPAFDSESGNAQKFGNFGDGEKVGEIS